MNKEFLILGATIIASGMAFLDGTVVNIAVPTIQGEFQASFASMLWVVNAFTLVLAALLLPSGALGDRLGRRRVFAWGIAIFTASSFLCGVAAGEGQLIAFRALQGLGAAMMIPGSLALINTHIAEARRGRAIGIWSGLSGGIAALGPLVGGWLVQELSWRAVFFINIPLGLAALGLTLYAVPESRGEDVQKSKFDLLGAGLISAGLFGLSYGLVTVTESAWSDPRVLVSLVTGAVALAAFFFVELRTKNPLVPLRIFSSPLVKGANLATLFLYFALNGLIFFVVLNLQQVQGLTPLQAGLGLLPGIVLITFLSGVGGSLADRWGPRRQMIFGPLVVAAGMALMIIPGTDADYFLHFLPGLVLFGLGMAFVIAPLTKSALSVPSELSGSASGVNNAVSRVAGLLAIAVLGAVAVPVFASSLRSRVEAAPLAPSERQVILERAARFGDIQVPDSFGTESARAAREAVDGSFVDAFRVLMVINVLLALASSGVAVKYIHDPERQ